MAAPPPQGVISALLRPVAKFWCCASDGRTPGVPIMASRPTGLTKGEAQMRTRRTFRWLPLLSLVLLLPAVGGQAAGDPALVIAAKNDDLQAVRALIAKRANVNEPARDGSTALLWATYNSNLDMARVLIDAVAPVNTPNHYGITPLLQASRAGDAP